MVDRACYASAQALVTTGAATPVPGGSGAMFDRIARRYDLLNRLMSFGMDRRWRKKTVAALELGRGRDAGADTWVLDLATGTADLAIDLARRLPAIRVVGLDPSENMLAVGRIKLARRHLADRVELVAGDAQALEFADARFAAVTMAFGIRNVPDRAVALREMARVTRPGGRIAILELSTPRRGPIAPLARFHIQQMVPRMGALISGASEYRYLERSIAAFPAPEEFADLMRGAGIAVIAVRPMSFGAAHLYVGTPRRERA